MRTSMMLWLAGPVIATGCSSGTRGVDEPAERSTESALTSTPITPGTQLESRFLQVSPGAICSILGLTTSPGPKLYADDYGVVRLDYYRLSATTGTTSSLALDCNSASGQHRTIDVESAPRTRPAAVGLAAGHQLRAALTGDPMTRSDAELRAAHYPPRPDPIKAPKMYRTWISLVSKDAEYVPASTVNVGNGDAFGAQNWCGEQLTAQPDIGVEGTFNVPTIAPVFSPCTYCATSSSGLWVGLSSPSSGLAQDGIAMQSYTILIGSQYYVIPSYYAFYELTPAVSNRISWTPAPSDVIFAYTWIGDAAGNQNVTGGHAWFEVYDETIGQFTETSLSFNGRTGGKADWILERNAAPLPIASFPSADMQGTFAVTSTLQEVDLSGFHPSYTMTNSSNATLATERVDSTEEAVYYTWVAGQ